MSVQGHHCILIELKLVITCIGGKTGGSGWEKTGGADPSTELRLYPEVAAWWLSRF